MSSLLYLSTLLRTLASEKRNVSTAVNSNSRFASVNPVGRVIAAIGQAAVQEMSRDVHISKSSVTNESENAEAADLIGDLADFARYTPFGLTIGVAEQLYSRDVNLETLSSQTDQLEAADIFGAIADFTRFTPLGAMAADVAAGLPWFARPGLAAPLALLATSNPFSLDHPGSGMLNGILETARGNVIAMLDKSVDLAAVTESWMKQIPDIQTNREQLARCADFQGRALLSCKLALEQARLANNAFVDFNHVVRDQQQRLTREITMLRDRVESVKARASDEMKQAQAPKVLDFFVPPQVRLLVLAKARQIEERMRQMVDELDREIASQAQALQTGILFMDNSKTWVDLCEQTSRRLGSIYNTLTSIRYGIKIDAQVYKELADTQWSQIRREADEVKTLLQPRKGAMDMVSMDLDGVDVDSAADLGANTSLVQVASPTGPLLQQLRAQASNSTVAWENLGKLQRITYTEDIVGYFDMASSRKVTLREVIGSVGQAYIQTAALHYETVEHISTLAILQDTRADNLAKGKISSHVFLKGTFTSISMVRKKAARVKTLMTGASPEISAKLEMIKASIQDIKRAIESANLDMARRDKAYRDKVTGVIVEGCLTGFATGGLVAAAAFAAYSGVAIASIPALLAARGVVFGSAEEKNEEEQAKEEKSNGTNGQTMNEAAEEKEKATKSAAEEVEGITDKEVPAKKNKTSKDVPVQKRVEAAQDTWTALSGIMRSAKDAASATQLGRALFNDLSLVDLALLVELVKTAVIVMERTVEAVENLTKPLEDLLDSVSDVADILDGMDAQCRQYQVPAGGLPVQFGPREAEAVKARWAEVSEACEVWLDIFNRQRISPISYSVI
ncbi:hypothetical protein FZEAL_1237 [Fusarium zealandicum]|uniref:Uncharacterized protein n=1 Tax=Fusarium zealandicum TaxID=1053134 RepID=A0A8H4UT52_9HYPO|nr:hypothetical protein FZEAL_1237 [Fusarium zealandicum]